MHSSFSFRAMLSSGWHLLKRHWKFIITAGIATAIVNVVLRIIENGTSGSMILSLIVSIGIGLISIVITLGWSQVLLMIIRTDTTDWDAFKTKPTVWLQFIKAMIWYILYFVLYVIGPVAVFGILAAIGMATHLAWLTGFGWAGVIISLIVAAIYFGIRYKFIAYVVLDNPTLESKAMFKRAGELTNGEWWHLFLFAIVTGLINLLGLICLVVGLMVTIPLTKIAWTKTYDYLRTKHDKAPIPASENQETVIHTV